jgi:hypothetical protein
MAVEIITTALVTATAESPAGPYDLTDLETVNDELSIPANDTSNNAFLSRAITQASIAIKNYCNRVFQVEAVQDQIYIQQDPYPYQVPGGVFPLQLSRWPLIDSRPISFTGNTHGSVLVDGIASTAGLEQGDLVFAADGSIPAGAEIANVVGSNSINLTKAASSSATGLSMNTGLQVIQTLSVGVTQTLVYGKDFTIDAAKGWLIRLNPFTAIAQQWEAVPATVQYQGGYDPIPDDLVDAALRMVTARFRARGRDPVLMARTQDQGLGTERYWVGAGKGQIGSIPPEVVGIIDNYRVPVIA